MEGKVETIDLTPEVLKTPEGVARVNKAMNEMADATANVANFAAALLEAKENADMDETAEVWAELREAVTLRKAAQEAFLRALAGRA